MYKKVFLLLFFISSSIYAQVFDEKISLLATNYESDIIELRHWFHENAELSNREFKTAERIAAELKKIGLNPQIGVAKTGVVAVLKGGKPGPVVALRADMDGLPVKERADLPWKSNMTGEYNGETVPVMHACGHDTHTAILLGTAKILYELRDQIPGTIKFIFQPAEEGAPAGEEGGAELMVKEGVLTNPNVDAIFGLHIWSQFSAGQVFVRPMGIMAAVNEFRIDIEGIQTTSGFEQVNARVNVFQKLLDDKLRIQTSIGITSRDASNGFQRALAGAQRYNPTAPIYNPDGTFYQNVGGPSGTAGSYNPVAINEQGVWDLDTNTMLANFKADYDLTSNLTVSASYSSQFKTMTDGKYYDNDAYWVGQQDGGRAEKTISDEKFNLSEFTVTYNGELNDLNYEVLAGYAYQEFTFSNQYAYNTDFLTNEPGYNGLGLGLGIKDGQAGIISNKQESKLASTFTRLNLNYQNLAFFSASIRNEQSSRFGPNKRSGTFWATSAGVDLNKIFESFKRKWRRLFNKILYKIIIWKTALTS